MSSQPSPVSRKTILIRLAVPGFHKWKDAPAEVGFLRSRHRHVFCFRVEYDVDGSDRELEFFLMQREVKKVIASWVQGADGVEFGGQSCEMIAERLHGALPTKPSAVEVFEDDENGARVEFR